MRKLLLFAALAACSLQAAIVHFDTGNGTQSGSGFTNSIFFNAGDFTVTATAFSLLNNGDTFSNAQLGQYSTGLGACNSNEGLYCGSPDHQFDNGGSRDFLLLVFSQAVTINSVTIDPYAPSNADRDVAYFLGNVSTPLDLNGTTLAQLVGLGFGGEIDNNGTQSLAPRTVDINAGTYNALLFGTKDPTTDSYDDYFKVYALDAGVPTSDVPEPGSMVLIGTGLVGLGLIGKRRVVK